MSARQGTVPLALMLSLIGLATTLTSPSDAGPPAQVRILTGCPEIRWVGPQRSSPDRYDFNAQRLAGGCVLQAKGRMRLRLASVVGDMYFAECDVRFTMRLDDAGVVAAEHLQALGSSPCDDVYPCHRRDGLPLVMKGRVEPGDGDRQLLRMSMCVDSCLGRFSGMAIMDLVPGPSGSWRIAARDGRVALGDSGWRFEGDGWDLRTESEVEIR
jgi:hypothetical protein